MEPPSITVTLVDGTRAVVPDTLDLMTPYVLQERHDWFEHEIRFVRRALQSGDRAIDVGANYGLYTLAMARAVGRSGRVWSFEPATRPASYLARSLAANDFPHVTLDRRALSREAGSAELALYEDSEMNALGRGSGAPAAETVAVTTLDEALNAYEWDRIDFIKIDAEGEESNIVKGATRFFETLSPLVQYELKAGNDYNLALVAEFAARGYASYRLIPALGALAPVGEGFEPDGFLLNLFACRPQVAERLAARNLLVRPPIVDHERDEYFLRRERSAASGLRRTLASLKRRLSGAAPDAAALDEALAMHRLSADPAIAPGLRYVALQSSVEALARLSAARPTPLRLASYARALIDFGWCRKALDVLIRAGDMLFAATDVAATEPCLPPSARFDGLPRTRLRDWLLAATLDAVDRECSYSTYFNAEGAKARLAIVESLGYADDDVRRRLSLLRRTAPQAT